MAPFLWLTKRTIDVRDRFDGFTAVTRRGTLWRPASVAKHGTIGQLIVDSICEDTFYQTAPAVRADYRIPFYSYRVRVWWDAVSGERIA